MNENLEPTRGPAAGGSELDEQRRLLELELIKIRSEASAARLEARAAEIELMIRQLGAGRAADNSSGRTTVAGPIDPPPVSASAVVADVDADDGATRESPPSIPFRFESWDAVRAAAAAATRESTTRQKQTPDQDVASIDHSVRTRVDSGQAGVNAPHFSDAVDEPVPDDPPDQTPKFVTDDRQPRVDSIEGQVAIDSEIEAEEQDERRRRPAAWLVSAMMHVAVLVILAAVSFQAQRPRDQVALTASATEASEVSMDTFSIESDEPQPEVTEPTPSETEYDLSPVGEFSSADFRPETPPSRASPAASAISSNALSSAAAMSLKSESAAKIQFCGVEGGGNHFVYLVDSSGSMGEGFASARAELLASIANLKPEQRFYVVFFDAESDYMRLGNPDRDEPSSVYATPENKAALKRWAMRIAMDRGRAPYDALEFALELRPDVIFLLSDGEFPQGIEDLLKEENRVENLFGDRHPISIVHTISYHSQEGESRMRRIAQQNAGQYRYIPKP